MHVACRTYGVTSYLHVAQLGKGLVAVVQSANERLHALVGLHVCADITSLSEATATLLTGVGALASMTTHVSLCITVSR